MVMTVCLYQQSAAQNKTTTIDTLRQHFLSPPASAKPWVFWYWMQAAVSKRGITADLEAMKEAGIGGAYLMPIKDTANPPYIQPAVRQLSSEWWTMVRFAQQEAKRLGLQLALHVSDGFALAGGPWITPELSMQKITWSSIQVSGNRQFNDTLPLPPCNENYYRDIAVFAFRERGGEVAALANPPVVTTSITGADAQFLAANNRRAPSGRHVSSNEPCWIQYAYDKPFTCRTIIIRTGGNNYQAQRLLVEASNDGRQFHTVCRLQSPRHGWQDTDADVTHTIAAVTARYFRFVYDKTGSEPGAEDLDAAKWKPTLRLTGIELLSAPRLYQYEGKTGEVWRISKRTDSTQLPDSLCLPRTQIIDISAYLHADGRLVWKIPPGQWTILRMGHTSTGHTNATGGAGKGLECDKFNPAAVKLQFNNWFGEALRRAGDSLTGVIKLFHVDSWECGSQNWSPVFRAAFRQKRGYDLLPWLPVMAGIPVQSADASERVLHDIRNTIAELVNDSFYVTLAALAHRHGCLFTAESVAPTMTGDGMLHYKSVDIPMGEFWLNSPTHDKPNDMLDAVSGAHVYGKNIIQAEGFTTLRMDWNEYPALLKPLQDRNYALGINRLVYHVFVHNPRTDRKPGMTLDGVGLYFQRNQTWWKPGKAWVSYAQRCQYLLQLGHPIADLAVFTGDDIPRRAVLPDRLTAVLPGLAGKARVEKEAQRQLNTGEPLRELPAGVFHSANMADPADWTDPFHGYKYDSFNPDVLLHRATVKNGRIMLPGSAGYGMLVLPGIQAMQPNARWVSAAVAQRILQLVKEGATVLLDDTLAASPGLLHQAQNDKTVAQVYTQLAGAGFKPVTDNNGERFLVASVGKGRVIKGPFLPASLEGISLPPDCTAMDSAGHLATGIAFTHRQSAGLDIYFISNQLNIPQALSLSLRIAGRVPELWDAVTGSITEAGNWKTVKDRTLLTIRLDAAGSLFIVLRKPSAVGETHNGHNWYEPRVVQTLPAPWKVQFDTACRGPLQPVVMDTLANWSLAADTAVRYYSGTAVYTQPFIWNGPAPAHTTWLDLGIVKDIAQVFVNGVDCGIVWTAPWRADITKALRPGNNSVSIAVTNTWANRLQGDHRLPESQRFTWTTAPYHLEGKPLPASGLLGPVTLQQ